MDRLTTAPAPALHRAVGDVLAPWMGTETVTLDGRHYSSLLSRTGKAVAQLEELALERWSEGQFDAAVQLRAQADGLWLARVFAMPMSPDAKVRCATCGHVIATIGDATTARLTPESDFTRGLVSRDVIHAIGVGCGGRDARFEDDADELPFPDSHAVDTAIEAIA